MYMAVCQELYIKCVFKELFLKDKEHMHVNIFSTKLTLISVTEGTQTKGQRKYYIQLTESQKDCEMDSHSHPARWTISGKLEFGMWGFIVAERDTAGGFQGRSTQQVNGRDSGMQSQKTSGVRLQSYAFGPFQRKAFEDWGRPE